jgi:formyltetrahydrofolate hydrolase
MTILNNVHVVYPPVKGRYPQVGREALPVSDVGRLLLRCADRPGLVAAVSTFLAHAGANIVSLDQHSTERSGGTFMQRTIFHLPGLSTSRDALECDFGEQVAAPFNMDFGLTEASKPKRVAIMASKDDHCLLDLLWRNRRGELDMSVVMVISKHYVTEQLDDGPIIEQDVVRVDHRDGVWDLTRLGADVERAVLSRAVLWHCEDRIIRYGNQTIVF